MIPGSPLQLFMSWYERITDAGKQEADEYDIRRTRPMD